MEEREAQVLKEDDPSMGGIQLGRSATVPAGLRGEPRRNRRKICCLPLPLPQSRPRQAPARAYAHHALPPAQTRKHTQAQTIEATKYGGGRLQSHEKSLDAENRVCDYNKLYNNASGALDRPTAVPVVWYRGAEPGMHRVALSKRGATPR